MTCNNKQMVQYIQYNRYKFGILSILGVLLCCAFNSIGGEILQDTLLSDSTKWYAGNDKSTEECQNTNLKFSFGESGCTVSVLTIGAHAYCAGINQFIALKKSKTYTITVIASADSSDPITLGFRYDSLLSYDPIAIQEINLKPVIDTFTLRWINNGTDATQTEHALFRIALGKSKGKIAFKKLSVVEQDVSSTDIDDFACPVPPKKDAIIKNAADLPKGIVVFITEGKSSIFISELNKWNPVPIPNLDVKASNLSLSDDGRWVLYHVGSLSYLVRIDGKYKTAVPTSGDFLSTGFVRSGPFGEEVFGDSKTSETITGIQVTFKDTSVSFGNQRIIANLGSDYQFSNWYRITIAKDQIWTAIDAVINSTIFKRSGFCTIPDSGRAIANSTNVYKFKNDDFEEMWGCNHTMSHDGKYCVAIPGLSGESGAFCHCSPRAHRGFYVSRFYHSSDTSIYNRDHVLRYATSLNWCPGEYNFGNWEEVDFCNYYFTNDNRYLVASQNGPLSPRKGLWAIRWEDNTWYPLSPDTDTLSTKSVAAYIGNYDSKLLATILPSIDTTTDTSSSNPIGYKILKPTGGELFYPGDLCTLRVMSTEPGNAAVKLQFGKQSFSLLSRAINPKVDSMLVITIPEFFLSSKIFNGTIKTDTIKPYSADCKIVLQHYVAGVCDPISSNGTFTIASKTAILASAQNKYRQYTVTSKSTIERFLSSHPSSAITQFTVYDLMGRAIVRWNLLSGQPFPIAALKNFNNHNIYVIKMTYIQKL